jgi:hypothetical protein
MNRCAPLAVLLVGLGVIGCIPPEWVEEGLLAATRPVEESVPASGPTTSAGSISLVVPAGWRATTLQRDTDVVVLRPDGVDDSAVQLAIPPGEEYAGELADWVADAWRALHYAKSDERMGQGRTPSGQRWIMVVAQIHTGLEGHKGVVFQTLADGTRVQPLFWYFRDDESLERYGADVDRITATVRFLPHSDRAAPRPVALGTLVPQSCIACVHTFTRAPPTTPEFLLGTWATGTTPGGGGTYEDSRSYTFRADGSYEFQGAIRSGGTTAVVTSETGRYEVQGNRVTLTRLKGEQSNRDEPRSLEPRTVTYEWRPALELGTQRPMLVIRGGPDDEWEGLFARGR